MLEIVPAAEPTAEPTADLTDKLYYCVVDAGSKAVDLVAGPPHVEGNRPYRSGGDEHGILDLEEGDSLTVGAKLRLYPSHCDPCVNLHDHWVLHRDGVVVEVLAVDARGSGC